MRGSAPWLSPDAQVSLQVEAGTSTSEDESGLLSSQMWDAGSGERLSDLSQARSPGSYSSF